MENNHSNLCDSDISSFRIVNVDYYMSKPVPGLDPIYSEFRGCDIKQVPVIRIFGTNLHGDKTCLHVHGAFPYMYIPYDGEKGSNVDGFMHQIASSLDKAINISLGHSQAATKHIFNISLVKGIPFYGYHSVEHQFFKIYFFNPFFVRRSAKLLQNGAIMNQIYQAHEAHVPYILNFFIDYNLYGMSFLHVPSDEVRYRRGGGRDDILLDSNEIQCQTVSKIEIDVMARSILNRMCYQKQTTEYLNPGISSIWHDERIRREKMDSSQVPPVAREVLEERFGVKPTESDFYYRNALEEKLKQIQIKQDHGISPMNGSVLQSTQSSIESMLNKSKKFDLKALIGNAVYPAESTQSSQSRYNFIDASFVENPYAKLSSPYSQLKNPSSKDSIINENIVLSLSQNNRIELNDTITDLEREILEEMDKLDYGNELNEIEMDSILAPLSQSQSKSLCSDKSSDSETIISEPGENNEVEATRKFIENFNKSVDDDPDDDLLNDFSIALESDKPIENSETKTVSSDGSKQQYAQRLTPVTDDVWDSSFWNNIELPQMDGASDCLNTPRKQIMRRTRSNVQLIERSPKSSPRATKSRYTQLDVQVIKSPKRIKREIFPKCKSMETLEAVLTKPNRMASSVQIKIEDEVEESKPIIKKLKSPKIVETNCRITRSALSPRTLRNSKKISSPIDLEMQLPRRRKRSKQQGVKENIMPKEGDLMGASMANDVAEEYDKKNNFFPVPGPSKLNSYAKIPSPPPPPIDSGTDPDDVIILKVTESVPEIVDPLEIPSTLSEHNEDENSIDDGICSFYDKTIILNSPDDNIDCSSPLFPKSQTPADIGIYINRDINISSQDSVIISLKNLPPSYNEVLGNLGKYQIPEVLPDDIHYSVSNDITSKREVGLSVLKVPFKTTYDDFSSCIDDLVGINKLRRNIITRIMNGENGIQMTTNKIREFLASEKSMVICPAIMPPSKHDAVEWLKCIRDSGGRTPQKSRIQSTVEDESPASVRREKIKMILGNVGNSDDDDENAESDIEITFSPLTPSHSERTPISVVKPLSSIKSSKSILSSVHKAKSTTKVRLSLTKKFNQMKKNRLKHELDSQADDMLIECGQKTLSQSSNTSDGACSVDSSDSINELLGLAKRAGDAHRLETVDDDSNRSVSDISGPTLDNTYGFKMQLENFQTVKAESEFDYLTIVSLEIFTKTRQDLKPDPEYDPIIAIFYSIQNNIPESLKIPKFLTGLIVHDDPDEKSKRGNYSVLKNSGIHVDQILYGKSEYDILEKFQKIIEIWDPDILVGYEIEMASWGYLIDRGNIIELNMAMKLSRIPSFKVDGRGNQDDTDMEVYTDLNTELKIPGRIILDSWRLLRHEIALTSYTFENIMYHVLHRRYPVHSHRDLTRFWNRPHTRWIVLQYYIDRCYGTLEILDQLDLIGRTCELAKLFGIQFYEVLSRGSQFRVESMMLRMAKPRNFVPVSPSVQQRAHMRAPEYIPLILEPESRMYLDPLIVLDFQSLYPSMMIAYNYCYSTCLGRVEHLGHTDPFEFGASHLKISKNLLKKLLKNDLITVSPCGVAFVKSTVREGTLPRMLKEILDTRLMVKASMKLHKSNNTLQRILHSRQLGLKLIANVTYGYTAANFSGRMPCSEVGDSVVSKGRETLERAIKLVEANDKWRCKVVYGDTDSLFVLVPGRDRKEAFRIGEEIAKAVTNDNPQPVKLKLEKIYQPSILQTKKRYVGYMYETADQTEPVYEAKGIETVRRDGCPAVAKILEKTIRVLFESKDVSLVKKYICRQFSKILSGRINIQDLIFAKEFRGVNGYKPGACVPSLELTRKWQLTDKRAIPRRGERVPFIIANGPPGLPLIRLVRSPHEMLSDEGLKINAMYYINKVIVPPLNRCLLLIGVDANEWIPELPRKHILLANNPKLMLNSNGSKKSTISQYFSTDACITDCGNQTNKGVCDQCRAEPQKTCAILCTKTAKLDRKLITITKVCQSCCGRTNETTCWSLDCPVLYKKNRIHREHNQTENYREILKDLEV